MSDNAPTSIDSSRTAIGPYEIVRVIGRGATGTVYLARAQDGSEVAIKVLRSGAADEAFERFSREVSVAQGLVHRHVVRVSDSGADEGVPYFVMEVLRGKSLRDLLKEHPKGLDVETAVDVVAQLCLGLHYVHEHGLVHRDVKPANVFVTDEGVTKLLDFGVAKFSDTTVTADGSLVGTLAYMAPEQLNAHAQIDGRADVFSAAVVLYELLTGQRPFNADSTAAMLARIAHDDPAPIPQSSEIDAIVRKALQKDPEARQASAQELAYDLWTALLAPRAAEGPHPAKPFDTIYANTPLEGESGEIREEPSIVAESVPFQETPLERPVVATGSMPQAVGILERSRTIPAWTYAAGAVLLASIVVAATMLRNRTTAAEVSGSNPPSSTSTAAGPSTSTTTIAEPVTSSSVSVDSSPPGASVVSEGLPLGQTPVQVTLRLGQTLLLGRSGYEPATVTIDAGTLADGRLLVTLTQSPLLRLQARGDYPFEVISGARVISASALSHDVNVPSGQTIRLRSAEYLLNDPVPMNASRDIRVPAPGTINVRPPSADNQCTVSIDGIDLSNPPINNKKIAAGAHTVEFKCPQNRGRKFPVTVDPGEIRTVR